jgi:hypothetical protein
MSEPFPYDVFLSHSSQDAPAVRELAQRLKKDGLRVWFDEWEIKPGDSIVSKIERGLEQSRVLVLAMSEGAFGSDWVSLERTTALFRDPSNVRRRFVPLRLDDAEIPDLLKQFAYVDWRQQSEDEYARLLEACRPVIKWSDYLAKGVWRCRDSTAGAALVGSLASDRFHSPTCRYVESIDASNRICFENRSAAAEYGHYPCKVCKS